MTFLKKIAVECIIPQFDYIYMKYAYLSITAVVIVLYTCFG